MYYSKKEKIKSLLQLVQGRVKKGYTHFTHEFYVIIDNRVDVINALIKVSNYCIIGNDETQPHVCNQKIAFSTGQLFII